MGPPEFQVHRAYPDQLVLQDHLQLYLAHRVLRVHLVLLAQPVPVDLADLRDHPGLRGQDLLLLDHLGHLGPQERKDPQDLREYLGPQDLKDHPDLVDLADLVDCPVRQDPQE